MGLDKKEVQAVNILTLARPALASRTLSRDRNVSYPHCPAKQPPATPGCWT